MQNKITKYRGTGRKNSAICKAAIPGPARKKSTIEGRNKTEDIVANFRNTLFGLKLNKKYSYEFKPELAKTNEDFIYSICQNYTGFETFENIGDAISKLKKVINNDNLDLHLDAEKETISAVEELSVEQFWHHYPIVKVINLLESNKNDLETYLSVIKIMANCGFTTWYSGEIFGYVSMIEDEYNAQAEYENLIDDDNYEDAQDLMMTILDYQQGFAKKFENKIKSLGILKKQILIFETKRIDNSKLRDWMLDAIELFYDGYNINRYSSLEFSGYEEGLTLDQTYSIVWNDNDCVFKYACNYMDEEANNCGYEIASLSYNLTNKGKVDFTDYENRKEFLNKVSKNWRQYIEMYESLN